MKVIIILVSTFLSPFFITSDLPLTNAKVVEYVNTVIGKKVDRGECWDLASFALNYADAKWEAPYKFGKPVNYKTEALLPGDIIQINGLTMESRQGNSITRWKMGQHTAIVYEVVKDRQLRVAEQNVNNVRKVMISDWNLDDIKGGKIQFFRPQAR